MTGSRIALGVLQGLGALSIIPYPAILVANVMGMAAEGSRGMQRLLMALPYALLSLYPFVWVGLYSWSWRAMAQGATGRAFLLSSVPAVCCVAGVGWYLKSEQSDRQRERARYSAERQLVAPSSGG
jgi:hypothetical protein